LVEYMLASLSRQIQDLCKELSAKIGETHLSLQAVSTAHNMQMRASAKR
jgi:hypothetical protein